MSLVESAHASEPPAITVHSADLSPEIAAAPMPVPVPAAEPALPLAEPASTVAAPKLPDGWPIYTEAPSSLLPPPSLALAPVEPTALPDATATQLPQPPALAPSAPPEFPLQVAATAPVTPPATPQITGLPVLAPTIDAIQIEGDSNFVAGTGPEGTHVRLYINDRLIDDSEVIEGRWLIEGVNLLDSPSSVLRIEAFDPATGEILGTTSVSVEIELPADAAPIAPPDPAPAAPPPADPPVAPLSAIPSEPEAAPEAVNDQQAEVTPAVPASPPIPPARPAKTPTAAPTAIPKLTPISPRKSSASVSVLPLPKADAYPTLRRAGPTAPSVQTLN